MIKSTSIKITFQDGVRKKQRGNPINKENVFGYPHSFPQFSSRHNSPKTGPTTKMNVSYAWKRLMEIEGVTGGN